MTKPGGYIDICFIPKHAQQQINKHSGGVSCSACNAISSIRIYLQHIARPVKVIFL